MFRPVDTKQSFPKLEEETIRFWKENDIFRKSVEQRPADRQFTFYEGPPYANAAPGVHHILPRVFKDVIVRYKTMRGYRVPRRDGVYALVRTPDRRTRSSPTAPRRHHANVARSRKADRDGRGTP